MAKAITEEITRLVRQPHQIFPQGDIPIEEVARLNINDVTARTRSSEVMSTEEMISSNPLGRHV